MAEENKIWRFMKDEGLTTKSEVDFLEEYADSANAVRLHKFFETNESEDGTPLTTKDFSEFYDSYLKKKDFSEQEPSTSDSETSVSESTEEEDNDIYIPEDEIEASEEINKENKSEIQLDENVFSQTDFLLDGKLYNESTITPVEVKEDKTKFYLPAGYTGVYDEKQDMNLILNPRGEKLNQISNDIQSGEVKLPTKLFGGGNITMDALVDKYGPEYANYFAQINPDKFNELLQNNEIGEIRKLKFANKRRIRGEVQNDLAQQIEQGRKSYYNLHSINTFTDQEIDNFLVNSASFPDFLSTFYPEEREVFGDALLSYKKETINDIATNPKNPYYVFNSKNYEGQEFNNLYDSQQYTLSLVDDAFNDYLKFFSKGEQDFIKLNLQVQNLERKRLSEGLSNQEKKLKRKLNKQINEARANKEINGEKIKTKGFNLEEKMINSKGYRVNPNAVQNQEASGFIMQAAEADYIRNLKKTDQGQLYKLFIERDAVYKKTIELGNKSFVSKVFGETTLDEMGGKYGQWKRTTDRLAKTTDSYSVELGLGESWLELKKWEKENPEEVAKAKDYYENFLPLKQQALAEVQSIVKIIGFNSDVKLKKAEGLFPFLNFVGEGFLQSLSHTGDAILGEDTFIYETNPQVARKYINDLKASGVKFSKDEEDYLETAMSEMIANGLGGSLQAIIEIMFTTNIAMKGWKAVNSIKKIKGLMTFLQSQGKLGKYGANLMQQMFVNGVAFGLTPNPNVSGWMGLGEGSSQATLQALFPQGKHYKRLSKLFRNVDAAAIPVGNLSRYVLNTTGGTLGETIFEYAGEFVDNLATKGVNWQEAVDLTLGRTEDEQFKKLCSVVLTCATMSGTFNSRILFTGHQVLNEQYGNSEDPAIQKALNNLNQIVKENSPKHENPSKKPYLYKDKKKKKKDTPGQYNTNDVVETRNSEAYVNALNAARAEYEKLGTGQEFLVDEMSIKDVRNIIKEGGKIFLTKDGFAGGYVTKDGYMGGLFKNPNSSLKNASEVIQNIRTQLGGTHFDSYSNNEELYIKNGFEPVARVKFDEKLAPKNWKKNPALKNKPDLVFFRYNPTGKYKKGDGDYVKNYDAGIEIAKNGKTPTKTEYKVVLTNAIKRIDINGFPVIKVKSEPKTKYNKLDDALNEVKNRDTNNGDNPGSGSFSIIKIEDGKVTSSVTVNQNTINNSGKKDVETTWDNITTDLSNVNTTNDSNWEYNTEQENKSQFKEHNKSGFSIFNDLVGNLFGTTSAYVVPIFPELTQTVPAGTEITQEMLTDFKNKNSEILSKEPSLAVTTRTDSKTGETYIDISSIVPKAKTTQGNPNASKQLAENIAKKYNQSVILQTDNTSLIKVPGVETGVKTDLGSVESRINESKKAFAPDTFTNPIKTTIDNIIDNINQKSFADPFVFFPTVLEALTNMKTKLDGVFVNEKNFNESLDEAVEYIKKNKPKNQTFDEAGFRSYFDQNINHLVDSTVDKGNVDNDGFTITNESEFNENKNDDSKDDSQGSPSETNQDSSNKEKSDAVNKRNNEVKTKKSRGALGKLFNWMKENILYADAKWEVKQMIKDIRKQYPNATADEIMSIAKIELEAGAGAAAKAKSDQIRKKILGGIGTNALSKKEITILNEIIHSERTISLDTQRDNYKLQLDGLLEAMGGAKTKKAKTDIQQKIDNILDIINRGRLESGPRPKIKYDVSNNQLTFGNQVLQPGLESSYDMDNNKSWRLNHPNGGKEYHEARLEEMQKDNPKKYAKVKPRVDIYFDSMREMLTEKYNQGLIPEHVYNKLMQKDSSGEYIVKYSPRKFIDHTAAFDSNINDSSQPSDIIPIETLEEGSTEAVIDDAISLMDSYVYGTELVIKKNQTRESLADFINESIEQLGENSTDMKNFGGKGISTNTKNYVNYVYYKDGKKQYFHLSNDASNSLERGVKQGKDGKALTKALRVASGAPLIKLFATGINPKFAFFNFPRDVLHVLMSTGNYSSFLPFAVAQISYDIGALAVKGKAVGLKQTQEYKDYISEGGGMSFLTHQGQGLKSKGTTRSGKMFNTAFGALGALNEQSEIMVRLAVRNKRIRTRVNQFVKKNGRQPSEIEMKKIQELSTNDARQTIDFSQGGKSVKQGDNIIPYLNAAFKGLSVTLQYAKENPLQFGGKVVQFMGAVMALTMRNLDDDNKEDYDKLSDYEKTNNFIFFLPGVNPDTNRRRYIRVRKDHNMIAFSSVAESLANRYKNGPASEIERAHGFWNFMSEEDRNRFEIAWNVSLPAGGFFGLNPFSQDDKFPPVLTSIMSQIPTVSVFTAYDANYDTFRDQAVYYGADYTSDFAEINQSGKYADKTDKIFVDIGQKTRTESGEGYIGGLSPERIKRSVGKLITNPDDNIYFQIVNGFYNNIDEKLNPAESKDFNENRNKLLEEYIEENFKEENMSEEEIQRMNDLLKELQGREEKNTAGEIINDFKEMIIRDVPDIDKEAVADRNRIKNKKEVARTLQQTKSRVARDSYDDLNNIRRIIEGGTGDVTLIYNTAETTLINNIESRLNYEMDKRKFVTTKNIEWRGQKYNIDDVILFNNEEDKQDFINLGGELYEYTYFDTPTDKINYINKQIENVTEIINIENSGVEKKYVDLIKLEQQGLGGIVASELTEILNGIENDKNLSESEKDEKIRYINEQLNLAAENMGDKGPSERTINKLEALKREKEAIKKQKQK